MTRRKVTREQGSGAGGKTGKGDAGRRIGPALFALLGVLAIAAIIAIVATGGDDTGGLSDGQEASPTGEATVTGDPLPAFAEGNDPAVGLPAPPLEGQDFQGQPIAIADDGRPKAIIFLAHWCPHCQAEVPLVQEWLDAQGMPPGVDLYSVATAIDPSQPNYPPEEWLTREGWTVPVLVDDTVGSAAQAYGLTAFPYFVFIDAAGNVDSRAAGELTIEELEGFLTSIEA